ncbi:hypothetical protein B7P43_G04514 [Cryptotermes secundus]|uniref:Uncharacterized protein n=1 Tax=Cryptotermes secundus TaxID=105785 RepID=A0A2J7QW06_9NEOP|nr:hypothetical protein B7P43_G04514 [Cryptotermes secundus]
MTPQLWRLEYLRREGAEREQDVEGGEDRSKNKNKEKEVKKSRMWEEEMQNRKEEEERM